MLSITRATGAAGIRSVQAPATSTEPVGAAGQGREPGLAAHQLDRLLEPIGAVQAADLDLVGDQDVDMMRDQVGELGALAVDAERVRER